MAPTGKKRCERGRNGGDKVLDDVLGKPILWIKATGPSPLRKKKES